MKKYVDIVALVDYISCVNKIKKVKVQITLTAENQVWLEKRLAKWNGSAIACVQLTDIVQGCVTLCRKKGL